MFAWVSRLIEDKKSHYELVKHYFRKRAVERKGYYDAKHREKLGYDSRELKIWNICFSITDKILQNNTRIKRLIDVGCGVGDFTLDLAAKYSQFEKIVGVDFLKENVDIACQKAERNKNVSFFEANLPDMPFVDRSFDVTICINVLHHVHVDDFNKTIKELARVTDKYLILEIRNKKNIFNFWYKYIVIPLLFKDLPVCDCSTSEVDGLIKDHFKLQMAKGNLPVSWGCRRLVIVYKRI